MCRGWGDRTVAPWPTIDLAPALIETARERAAERRLDIDYRVGDCELLDVPDERFDAVSSTCGVMFAPDHTATARRACPCHAPRRADRARQLDGHRRRRADVQGDGAVPARHAAEQPRSTGARRLARRPREELHRAWVDFFETDYRHNGDTAHTREYLLVVGVRR